MPIWTVRRVHECFPLSMHPSINLSFHLSTDLPFLVLSLCLCVSVHTFILVFFLLYPRKYFSLGLFLSVTAFICVCPYFLLE
jgi:hypothetical protein